MDTWIHRCVDTQIRTYIHAYMHACTSFFSFYIYIHMYNWTTMYVHMLHTWSLERLFRRISSSQHSPVSWVSVALLTPVKVITRSSSTDDNLIVRSRENSGIWSGWKGWIYTSYILKFANKKPIESSFAGGFFSFWVRFLFCFFRGS